MASLLLGFLYKCQAGASEPFTKCTMKLSNLNIFEKTRMFLPYKQGPFSTVVAYT